jgi:GLPGLI family protein
MKKIFASLLVLVSITSFGQNIGTVVYERKINMHRRITDEQMKAMIPEWRISKHQLIFSDSVSVYKTLPEAEAPDPFEGGGGRRMVFNMGGGDGGVTFKNFSTSTSLMETDLGDKTYIVEDSIRQQGWKLSDETKTILGIVCKKATTKIPGTRGGIRMQMGGAPSRPATDTTRPPDVTVVAWYAESLITPVGPENYGNLPGLVLQVDVNNGETVYNAVDIKRTADNKELKEPKKGKRIPVVEFRKKQQDFMANQMQFGGGGIRIGG